jgi:hypothetical protein
MVSKSTTKSKEIQDILFTSVTKMLRKKSKFVGTMTDLNLVVARMQGINGTLVSTPSALRVVLNKVVNRLRNAGVSVRFTRSTDKARSRLVKFSV